MTTQIRVKNRKLKARLVGQVRHQSRRCGNLAVDSFAEASELRAQYRGRRRRRLETEEEVEGRPEVPVRGARVAEVPAGAAEVREHDRDEGVSADARERLARCKYGIHT